MTRRHDFWLLRFLILALFLLLFAFPFVSRAEVSSISAGFAKHSIWISRTHVVAGDSVNIFTVLYNSSDNSISGDVIFAIDSATIGTKNFTLGAGETQTVSLPWVAKAGDHTVSARIGKALETNTNTATSVLNQTTGNITVSIEAPPPPSQASLVLGAVTSAIATGAASTTPVVASALKSFYGTTESFRLEAKSALEKKIAESAESPSAAKSVSRQKDAVSGGSQPASTGTAPSAAQNAEPFLSTAGKYAALAGLTVVSSKTLFYISLALVFILLIQMLRVLFRERRGTRRNRFTGYS